MYDAWGNHKVVDTDGNEITDQSHIGNLNPFRYRGYYYDRETGLYFLQTRYYDPETGRFLNRDAVQYADLETINGLNLYAYCLNNPVNYIDPFGKFVMSIGFAIASISAGLFAIFAAPKIVEVAGDIADTIVDSIEALDIPDVSVDSYLPSGSLASDIEAETSIVSPTITIVAFDSRSQILQYSEHRTNKRKSNLPRHEKGQKQKKMNKPGGEKGDARRSFRRNGKSLNKMIFCGIDYLIFLLF